MNSVRPKRKRIQPTLVCPIPLKSPTERTHSFAWPERTHPCRERPATSWPSWKTIEREIESEDISETEALTDVEIFATLRSFAFAARNLAWAHRSMRRALQTELEKMNRGIKRRRVVIKTESVEEASEMTELQLLGAIGVWSDDMRYVYYATLRPHEACSLPASDAARQFARKLRHRGTDT